MQGTKLFFLIGCAAAAILIAVPVFIIKSRSTPTNSEATSTDSLATSTIVDLGGGVSVKLPPGVKITPVDSIEAPDLNHVIAYSQNVSPDTMAVIKKDVPVLIAELKKDPSQGSVWLKLATYYKIAGDMNAAEAVWVYMTEMAPSNYIAFSNLGDLYMNFLKDYPKAETNYLQVIKLQPDYIQSYQDLFTLYHSFYKTNTPAAADIVAQGLKLNPGNSTLLALQAQLKAGK